MNRHGFALLAVLWVLTALTALTGAGLLVARLGSETTRNRMLLARAEWGREACGEILLARFAIDPTIRTLDPIDLGRRTWCRASLDDPAAKLNLNTADGQALAQLFTAVGVGPALAESVIVQRARGTLYDLLQVPGVDSTAAAHLAPFVTVRGTGVVNVNTARREVLRTLPGMAEESVFLLTSRRALRPVRSADELAGLLSRSARTVFLGSYAEFVRAAVFDPPQLIVTIEGGVRGTPIVARETLTAVPLPGRLAVIRRETE
jgi:DNA uptake protein ComE-like DNA-binding protein